MKQFIAFLTLIAFSFNSFAQIEFAGLLEKSIAQQNVVADDVRQATQMANNIENETELLTEDKAKTVKIETKANPTDSMQAPAANEKDFAVKLQPNTGRASAAKYFPYVPKAKRNAKHRSSKNNIKLTKNVKIKKMKSRSIATASVSSKKTKTNKNKKATSRVASK